MRSPSRVLSTRKPCSNPSLYRTAIGAADADVPERMLAKIMRIARERVRTDSNLRPNKGLYFDAVATFTVCALGREKSEIGAWQWRPSRGARIVRFVFYALLGSIRYS